MRISDWRSDVCSSDLAIDWSVIIAASKTITDQSIASYTSPGRRALTRTSPTTVAVKATEDETSPNEVAAMAAAKGDRRSDEKGKSEAQRVERGSRRDLKKNNNHKT